MTLADDILDSLPDSPSRIVPVTCVATSPFQVSIAGTAAWVPAKRFAGQTFSVGDKGMAFHQPPLPPYCFKTI